MEQTVKPDGQYVPVTTIQQLEKIVNESSKYKYIAIDTESSGVDSYVCDLYGISISFIEGEGFYIPLQMDLNRYEQVNLLVNHVDDYLDLHTVKRFVQMIFNNENHIIIMHNAKFDIRVLERHGFTINHSQVEDTMLSSWVVGNLHKAKFGLKDLSSRVLGYKMSSYKETAGNLPFYKVELQKATDYAAADSDMTLRLFHKVNKYYDKIPSLKFIRDLENGVLSVLYKMENNGVLIDKQVLMNMQEPMVKEINKSLGSIYSIARRRFNVNSNAETLQVLTALLPGKKFESVDANTLKYLSDDHPIIQHILNYRQLSKLNSTYVKGILTKIRDDGRLHTDYRQHGITTGRLASADPNLQNIPIRTEAGANIRSAFIPSEGNTWVSADYSQVELRILAHIAKEKRWIDALNDGADIHQITADLVGVTRKQAKTVNFGLVYGITEFGLSKQINMSVEDTRDFIKEYFSKLPNIRRYITEYEDYAINRFYVETLYGRRRYFKYKKDHGAAIAAVKREGINAPIQGTAADIMKQAMIKVQNYLEYKRTNTLMTLQVHDELDFDMPFSNLKEEIPEIVKIMTNVANLSVPLKVDVEIGTNWRDIKEYV